MYARKKSDWTEKWGRLFREAVETECKTQLGKALSNQFQIEYWSYSEDEAERDDGHRSLQTCMIL